jgi:hypothetical protein
VLAWAGLGHAWALRRLAFCLVIVPDQGFLNCAVINGKEKVYGSIP